MATPKSQVWGSHLTKTPAEHNVLFCAGRDVQALPMADEALLPYDIWTNRAHSIMLFRQGLIAPEVLRQILAGLDELEQLRASGEFKLDPQKEDVHINVEAFITQKYGIAIGGVMHTGRSRNDQTSCDTRLYAREACLKLAEGLLGLIQSFITQAKAHTETFMPGFTHYQPGMITTWGHWLASYAQSSLRDLERARFAFGLVNRNPLGAAASFGTSWPIDRQITTELLGFERPETNTLDAITARWENEAQLAQTYAMLMNHLSIISQDLILLSFPYVGMLKIDEAFVTGSSIMPQKKNPDFAEVIKSKASFVHGALISLLGIQKGGLSGYNRDTQLSKYLIMDVVRECEGAPLILQHVFESLEVRAEVMLQRCREGFMNSVDVADWLARRLGLSFRECYNILALTVKYSTQAGEITHEALTQALREAGFAAEIPAEAIPPLNDPRFLVEQRQHQGAPAPAPLRAHLAELSQELAQHSQWLANTRAKLSTAYEQCKAFQP